MEPISTSVKETGVGFNPLQGFFIYGTRANAADDRASAVLIPCRDSLFMELCIANRDCSSSGFNPLQGFFIYGTYKQGLYAKQTRRFNPLQGFFIYGTGKLQQASKFIFSFNPLQGFFIYGTLVVARLNHYHSSFNPLQGFFIYGTSLGLSGKGDLRGVLIPCRDSLFMEPMIALSVIAWFALF